MLNNNLSVIFFLQWFLNKIPYYFIQILLDYSLKTMQEKYPRVFSKISDKEDLSFLINPIDLPFNFFLVVGKTNSSLTVEQKTYNPKASAVIKAKLITLLDMFEGKLDGDAAFFSQSLIIEGSTAAIVTLRNALESENINIVNDLTDKLGWFKGYFRKGFFWSLKKNFLLNQFLINIQEELLSNCNYAIKSNTQEINKLKQELNILKSTLFNK